MIGLEGRDWPPFSSRWFKERKNATLTSHLVHAWQKNLKYFNNDRDTFWNFFRMSWEASGGRVRHDDSDARYSFGGSRYSFGGSQSRDNAKQAYEETFAYTPLNAQGKSAFISALSW